MEKSRRKILNPRKSLAALLAGAIGLHRILLRQYWLAALYIYIFLIWPLVAVMYGLVDALSLATTPLDRWLDSKNRPWQIKTGRRIKIWGTIAMVYFGTSYFPFLPGPSYSGAEPPSFFSSFKLPPGSQPIFYRDDYNIRFFGLEKLHPFDSQKYGRIFERLKAKNLVSGDSVNAPPMLSDEMLQKVHPPAYLNSLRNTFELLKILEIPVVNFLPWQLTHRQVLKPMRYATSGTVLGALAAWERGWSINLGGGYHHAHATAGGGFCVYADITLAIRNLREALGHPVKVMIVDLDAHQGNGHEHDFLGDPHTFILDAFNPSIYPGDMKAREAIGLPVFTQIGMGDAEYLEKLQAALNEAPHHFEPEFVLYNAGTDIMAGDPLGRMNISPKGIKQRDEMVFSWARSRKIPIEMVLSGGYQKSNAAAIADSIENLLAKVLH